MRRVWEKIKPSHFKVSEPLLKINNKSLLSETIELSDKYWNKKNKVKHLLFIR